MYCELVEKKHGIMINNFCGVFVSVLILSAIDLWFEHRPDQIKDYIPVIDICCFFAKRASSLRSKRKDWLDCNHDNVSELEQHVYM